MSYTLIKSWGYRLGLYRSLRWVNRHVINRKELHDFQKELDFYSQFVKPNSLCFDVGANYGLKTEVFLRLGAKVVAFEPQPECIKEIESRLGQQSKLTIEQTALGQAPGQMTLYIMSYRTKSSLLKDWQGEQVGNLEVPVSTLDRMIAKYGVPNFCKIDVEGFELEVLKGLSQPIPMISFEYHTKQEGPTRAIDCLEYLAQFGELTINVAPAEVPCLATFEPLTKADFLDYFKRYIPNMKGYEYGDIFVGIATNKSH
ncbi:MAG: FkbM family methyltransferase [Gemmatales bacterium]